MAENRGVLTEQPPGHGRDDKYQRAPRAFPHEVAPAALHAESVSLVSDIILRLARVVFVCVFDHHSLHFFAQRESISFRYRLKAHDHLWWDAQT